MDDPSPDFPRCRMCRRRLKTPEARARGFGSTCWPRRVAYLKSLDQQDPRAVRAGIPTPLFPEELK
ncbi:DUF6011 domain-containing protein [Mesoterricola silvestris]|uniref:DUF6011 domain-containing protein n=1 Tax=Mesoterricola silvestris TaxID=2927979 RepID=UPI003742E420